MMDMGGGSVQIAYEVDQEAAKGVPTDLMAEFNLGCQENDMDHTYRLYVTTFLGFGANSALDRYEASLIHKSPELGHDETHPITDQCFPSGMKRKTVDDAKVDHHFLGSGNFDKCKAELLPLTNKTVPCRHHPCSVNGVHQPSIDSSMEFFGFSEFWYTMEDVFGIGGHYNYDSFTAKAKEFCSKDWSTLESLYKQKKYPKADDSRFKNQCFKAAWLSQMLHKGFEFPTSYNHLTSATLVNGKDVGWTLGALIYKTRHLPLRDVERIKLLQQSKSMSTWRHITRLPDMPYLLTACFLVVAASILVYMKWLRCFPRAQDLQRVPSIPYFMTDQHSQMEQGFPSSKGQGYNL